ncbi:BLUF domain-containing protein [Maritalea sp.]|uniref:BLUF domain-containing protein n=1 Tax=Maritalea sp. TaxID=2003361 RepID=UPI003EF590D9
MIRLLYFSTAGANVTPAMINKIVSKASLSNEQRSVTGALAFNGVNFAQVLEGEADQVHPLMDAIRSDPRHTGVKEMMQKDIEERAFEGWGMKLVGGLEFDLLVDSMLQ